METHEKSEGGLPPVKVKVTLGKEDLSIKVRTDLTERKKIDGSILYLHTNLNGFLKF